MAKNITNALMDACDKVRFKHLDNILQRVRRLENQQVKVGSKAEREVSVRVGNKDILKLHQIYPKQPVKNK